LIDPEVEIRPVKGQIDDLLHEIRARVEKGERVLGDHADQAHGGRPGQYYAEVGVKWPYMHSEIETLEKSRSSRPA